MTRTDQASKPAALLATAEVERLADAIAEVATHIDAATHRLLTLIRRFDEGSGWSQHGALSCAHWLNWRIGLDLGAARERVRVARALGALPVLDDALRRGAVSYSKVRAITRVATLTNEAALLEMARHTTASQLERICRGFRRALTNLDERPGDLADEEYRRFVRVRDTHDGMVRIDAQLRPEEAAMVMQALDVARHRAWRSRDSAAAHDVSAETPLPAISVKQPGAALARADALVAVAESYLSSEAASTRTSNATPIELVVHVDAATLREDDDDHDPAATVAVATLDDGTALAPTTAQRLACDARVVQVIEDPAGNVRAIGRRTRRISATLRRALRARRRLPLSGLYEPSHRRAPHRRLVARRQDAARQPVLALPPAPPLRARARLPHRADGRGELMFHTASGELVPLATPIRPSWPHEAFTKLRERHATLGLAIDGRTALPLWNGDRIDYHLVVQALVPA